MVVHEHDCAGDKHSIHAGIKESRMQFQSALSRSKMHLKWFYSLYGLH
jgi:hypothetical protein